MRYRRLHLKRPDTGETYLNRWGLEGRWGGVFLHLLGSPDLDRDLHDHPWWFVTVPLWGSYWEERTEIRTAAQRAFEVETSAHPNDSRGKMSLVGTWRPRTMRLDEAHRITGLRGRRAVTLVIHGPQRRPWGFYTPGGFVLPDEHHGIRLLVARAR